MPKIVIDITKAKKDGYCDIKVNIPKFKEKDTELEKSVTLGIYQIINEALKKKQTN